MEKTLIKEETSQLNEKIQLVNRNKFTLEGLKEIILSNENTIYLKVKDSFMTITGKNLQIEKLDIDNKILQCNGEIDCIKYGKSGNIFKRIFK